MCGNAVRASEQLKKEGIAARVVHIATPASPDLAAIRAAAGTGVIVTVEDHVVTTGLGSVVAEALVAEGLQCRLAKLGVTKYASSGTPAELYAEYRLDPAGIAAQVKALVNARH